MRQLEVQNLAGFNETLIDEPANFDVLLKDGRTLDYSTLLSAVPAVTSSYDGTTPSYEDRYPNQLPLIADVGLEIWNPDTNYPAHRFAEFHGRNLEVMAGRVAISDENGNDYNSLCIKGGDLSDPFFMESSTASRKFIINGLQESLVVERVLRASKLLRQHNIPTEYICGLVLPEYFPIGDAYTNIDSGKTMELSGLLEKLAGDYAVEKDEQANVPYSPLRPYTKVEIRKTPLEIKTEMIERFSDCDYLITFRAMDTPFRMSELGDADRFEEFKAHLLQQDPDNQLLKEYLEEYEVWMHMDDLASQLGVDLARMHNIGLTHGFLSTTNITALGSIIDLDSVRGEALGFNDEPRTIDHEMNDVMWALRSISEVIEDFGRPLVETLSESLSLNYYDYVMTINFLQDYMAERYDTLEDKLGFINRFVRYELEKVSYEEEHIAHRRQEIAAVISRELVPESFFREPLKVPTYRGDEFLKRANRRLKNIPASLFESLQEKFLHGVWSTNNDHPEIDPENPIISPVSSMLEGVVLAQIAQDYMDDEACSEEDLLRYMLCSMSDSKDYGREAFPDESIEMARAYSFQVKQRFVASSREWAIERITPALRERLDRSLGQGADAFIEGISSSLGKLENKSGERIFDIIYTQSDDYESLLKLLGANNNAQFESVSAYKMLQELREVTDASEGVVLLVDNNCARFIAEADDAYRALAYMFLVDKKFDLKPTILVNDILSSQPQFYIVDNPNYVADEEEDLEVEGEINQEDTEEQTYNARIRAIDEFPVYYSYSEVLRLLKEGKSVSRYAPLALGLDGQALS